MVEYRQDFLRSFGEETAKRLCLESQEQTGINLTKGFTERDFIEVVMSLTGWVLLVQLVHRGDLRVYINEKGEILFDAA